MKHPIRYSLLAIFVLSIVVGVSAFGYQCYHSSMDEKAQYISEKISKKLDLTVEQNKQLVNLKDQILVVAKNIRQNKQLHREKLLGLMDKKQFDRKTAEIILNEKSDVIKAEGTPLILAFADFYDSLDTSQQQKIRDEINEN